MQRVFVGLSEGNMTVSINGYLHKMTLERVFFMAPLWAAMEMPWEVVGFDA